MAGDHRLMHLGLAAAAGLGGTVAIRAVNTAGMKWAPQAMPPMREDPGHVLAERLKERMPAALRHRITERQQKGAELAMALGYGVSFAALYGLLGRRRGSMLIDGAALGLAAWAAGWLGWLPAMGVMPPVWKHKPAQLAGPIATHLLYGVATVALLRGLSRMIGAEHES